MTKEFGADPALVPTASSQQAVSTKGFDPGETRPYRPANGTEGAVFMSWFCDHCERDRAFRDGTGDSCPIVAATMVFDIDDPNYPPEWREGEDGTFCTAFEDVAREVQA